jgi:MoaA/NifB/PqqE/SkfB family radical SAM enzyme
MKNTTTPEVGAESERAATAKGAPGQPPKEAGAADAWRRALTRRATRLAERRGLIGVFFSILRPVLGALLRWVARACAAAEDTWAEVQAHRRRQQSANDQLKTAQGGGGKGPAGQARAAENDALQVLESLSAEPVRGALRHLLPALEYQEVVRPLLAEIDRVYARFIFRKPTPHEVARHVHAYYKRFPALEDRYHAVRAGNIRPHLGARPLTVEIDVTNQCNLRCIMCHFSTEAFSKRKREDISVEDFTTIAEQMFPLCSLVHLTYICEPLLHPRFSELLAITKRYDVPQVTVTTNGTLLNEQLTEQLVVGGLGGLSISMDAATKPTYERIRRKGKFDKLMANIGALNRAKQRHGSSTPELAFNFVMMRSNIAELPALVRMAHELGAVRVAATHLTPWEGLDMEAETLEKGPELCNRMMGEARELAKEHQIELALPANFDPPAPAPEPLLQIGALGASAPTEAPKPSKRDWGRYVSYYGPPWGDESLDHCHFPWHFVTLTHDGWVVPCAGWDGPFVGNVLQEPFEDIWNSDRYRAIRSGHLNGTLKACLTCPATSMGNVNDKAAFAARKLE